MVSGGRYGAISSVMRLREDLRDYVHVHLSRAHDDGTPLLRPMVFEFSDPACKNATGLQPSLSLSVCLSLSLCFSLSLSLSLSLLMLQERHRPVHVWRLVAGGARAVERL